MLVRIRRLALSSHDSWHRDSITARWPTASEPAAAAAEIPHAPVAAAAAAAAPAGSEAKGQRAVMVVSVPAVMDMI